MLIAKSQAAVSGTSADTVRTSPPFPRRSREPSGSHRCDRGSWAAGLRVRTSHGNPRGVCKHCTQISGCILVYVYVSIGKHPKVITPMGVGHVWKYYIEFKCLPSLDLKVSSIDADTIVSDSPFQFFKVFKKEMLTYT